MTIGPPADPALQAPPEGGPFSRYFNEHTKGHGIHKWLQYFPAYMRHFQQFIGEEVHIMEIGIQSGGSLGMWLSVFGPKARVYGCDINPDTKVYESDRIQVFIGDQAEPEFWENVTKEVPKIDILIDDGGHKPFQQVGTLGLMLERLSPNGVYVTEDIHGFDNPFWHGLKFNQLDEEPFHFKDLGKFVQSVHVYPYLLVIEKAGGYRARHLGVSRGADVLPPVDKIVSGADADDLSEVVMALPPASVFVAQYEDTYNPANWDDDTDVFFSKTIIDFKLLHAGSCCTVDENPMQQSIDSLHFYPHLLIAQRTSRPDRLVKAPQHGTEWIPYA